MTVRMTATGERTAEGFTITVEHDRAQSFRRAVDPKAMREAQLFQLFRGVYGQAQLVNVDYGAVSVSPDRCGSVYHFTVS